MNTQRETHGREKVDAGNRNRNRPHRKVNQPRADNEASTGKRNAGKLARSVWKGGKAERPYLSLLLEKWERRCAYCLTPVKKGIISVGSDPRPLLWEGRHA